MSAVHYELIALLIKVQPYLQNCFPQNNKPNQFHAIKHNNMFKSNWIKRTHKDPVRV